MGEIMLIIHKKIGFQEITLTIFLKLNIFIAEIARRYCNKDGKDKIV